MATAEKNDLQDMNFSSVENSGSGEIFHAVNPQTDEQLKGEFHEATSREIDLACRKAAAAFKPYRNLPTTRRVEFLRAIADAILDLGDDLLNRFQLESGFPHARASGERARTLNQLNFFADLVEEGSWVGASIDHALPQREPLPKPDIRKLNLPMGPVVVFGSSNFPLAYSVAGGDTASALAAGCPVVVKPHATHPGTSELVASAVLAAAEKTGMPPGVFALIQGENPDVGKQLVKNPDVCAVGFTGSSAVGTALVKAAVTERHVPIPVYAEMGSSNPIFLLPGAQSSLQQNFLDGFITSLNMGTGQFCTGPGLLIMEKSPEASGLLNLLKEKISDSESGCMVNTNVAQKYISSLDEKSRQKGVEKLVESKKNSAAKSHVVSALLKISGKDYLSNPAMEAEIFGPACLVVECENKQELEEVAASFSGHLTGTVWADDTELEDYQELVDTLKEKVGRLIFNGYPTGVEVCPSMNHGGPFPSSSQPRFTSVGQDAIQRFVRPVCYQNCPDERLPAALQEANPLGIWRMVDGEWKK